MNDKNRYKRNSPENSEIDETSNANSRNVEDDLRPNKRAHLSRTSSLNSISNQGITPSSIRIDQDIQVFVHDNKGKTIIIKVNSDISVEDLLDEISSRLGIPLSMLSLSFGGKQMYSGLTKVISLGIKENSTIFCSVKPATSITCNQHSLKDRSPLNRTKEDWSTLFEGSIQLRHFYCSKSLISEAPQYLDNKITPSGYTAAMYCVIEDEVNILEYLIDSNCDLDAQVKDEGSAVHIAAKYNRVACLRLMLTKKPKLINILDRNNNLPLHTASSNGSCEALKIIIGIYLQKIKPLEENDKLERLKNDVLSKIFNAENKIGDTPLHAAMRREQIESSYILLNSNSFVKSNYLNFKAESPTDVFEQIHKKTEITKVEMKPLEADFRSMLDNRNFSDISFIVEGKQIYSHKVILCARSEYFRGMFSEYTKESQLSEIKITDTSYPIFFSLLEFLYTNTIRSGFDIKDLLQLVTLSDYYRVEQLKNLLYYNIGKLLNLDNVIDIFNFALKSTNLFEENSTPLIQQCIHFIKQNWGKIVFEGRQNEYPSTFIELAMGKKYRRETDVNEVEFGYNSKANGKDEISGDTLTSLCPICNITFDKEVENSDQIEYHIMNCGKMDTN